MNFSTIWPTEWPPAAMNAYGLLGDYIGGVWGTAISCLTAILVFFTWRVSQRSEIRNSIISIITEMLKTHDNISTSNNGATSKLLREFAAIYKISKRIEPSDDVWNVEDRIDICYTFAFYGLSSQTTHSLECYGEEKIKKLQEAVAKLRDKTSSKYKGLFAGHQATLSHYMRNIFSIYTMIDESRLRETDKLYLGKIVRSKLSNYEQAIIALNITSHLGREWETNGILSKYKPIANIPQKFFGYDQNISLKKIFPTVEFEWERERKKRPIYFTLSAKRYSITITIRGS